MPTLKMHVKGLGTADEGRAAARLEALDGVFSAVANAGAGCVEVDFEDDRASFAQMREALAELGMEARLAG